MPIFEFRCQGCGKKFSTLIGMTAEPDDARCPHCGSGKAMKLVSRFTRGRTEDDRVEDLADEIDLSGEPDSPSKMRGMMKEMGKALDEDMSEDMEEMFEADMEGKMEDED